MRLATVEIDAGQLRGAGQHGLAQRGACQGHGVQARERMEGVALDAGAFHRGVQESQIERGVVADQDRAAAAMRADGGADLAEDALQRIGFVQRRPQRMPGIDAIDFQ
jgi:hypothetical protein